MQREFRRFKKIKDQPCFTRSAVIGIACLERIRNNGTKDDPDCDFHVSNPVALLEPIPHKGKLMLYRSKIDAETPLEHKKYKTVGDYVAAFGK